MRAQVRVMLVLLTVCTTGSTCAAPVESAAQVILDIAPDGPTVRAGGEGGSGNGTVGVSQEGFECVQERAEIFVAWLRANPGDPNTPNKTLEFIGEARNCEPLDPDLVAYCQRKADNLSQWLVVEHEYSTQYRWVTVSIPGVWYDNFGPFVAEDLMWHYLIEFNKINGSECA